MIEMKLLPSFVNLTQAWNYQLWIEGINKWIEEQVKSETEGIINPTPFSIPIPTFQRGSNQISISHV